MPYEVFLEKRALKQLESFPTDDKVRLKETLIQMKDFPTGLDVKKLVGSGNKYRVRIGKLRVLMELEPGQIIVFDILHRKKAYK